MKHLSARIPAIPSNIGQHIRSVCTSIPLPFADTHLAAQALRSVGRGIARAARPVVAVAAPGCLTAAPAVTRADAKRLRAFRALTQLGMAAPDIKGLQGSPCFRRGFSSAIVSLAFTSSLTGL